MDDTNDNDDAAVLDVALDLWRGHAFKKPAELNRPIHGQLTILAPQHVLSCVSGHLKGHLLCSTLPQSNTVIVMQCRTIFAAQLTHLLRGAHVDCTARYLAQT